MPDVRTGSETRIIRCDINDRIRARHDDPCPECGCGSSDGFCARGPLLAALESPALTDLEFAAAVHGARPLTVFFRVTLSLIRTHILSGLLFVLTRASGEVGITMMLRGNLSGRTNTLSLEIFNAVSRGLVSRPLRLPAPCFSSSRSAPPSVRGALKASPDRLSRFHEPADDGSSTCESFSRGRSRRRSFL